MHPSNDNHEPTTAEEWLALASRARKRAMQHQDRHKRRIWLEAALHAAERAKRARLLAMAHASGLLAS